MKFTLQHAVETTGTDLAELISRARIGDRIILCRGIIAGFDMYPENLDFYYEDQQKIYRNETVVFSGSFQEWCASSDGFVVRIGNQSLSGKVNKLLLNGESVIYEGEMIGWAIHPQGGVVVAKSVKCPAGKGDDTLTKYQVLKDGKELIYESECSIAQLAYHPSGFLVRHRNWYINGVDLFGGKLGKRADFAPWGDGFLLRKGNEFLANGLATVHWDWGDLWVAHNHGIVIQRGKEVSLVVLKK